VKLIIDVDFGDGFRVKHGMTGRTIKTLNIILNNFFLIFVSNKKIY